MQFHVNTPISRHHRRVFGRRFYRTLGTRGFLFFERDNMSFPSSFSFSLCSRGNKISTLLFDTINFSKILLQKIQAVVIFSARVLQNRKVNKSIYCSSILNPRSSILNPQFWFSRRPVQWHLTGNK